MFGGGEEWSARASVGRLLPLVADLQLAQPLPQLVALLLALLLSEGNKDLLTIT